MAEGHAAVHLQGLYHKPGQINFHNRARPIRSILENVVSETFKQARFGYHSIYKSVYPINVVSVFYWSIGSYLIERFRDSMRLTQFIDNLQQSAITHIEKSWQIVQNQTINLIFSRFFQQINYNTESTPVKRWIAKIFFYGSSWFAASFAFKYFFRYLMSYDRFIFEDKRTGFSLRTKIWAVIMKLARGHPSLYGCQSALPKLPLPGVQDTCERYLKSIEPISSEEEFKKIQEKAVEFERGIGFRLQLYLKLQRFFTDNLVTKWWEKYIYLKPRSPICINSNYYIIGQGNTVPTKNQAARAAVMIYSAIKFRSELDSEKFETQFVSGFRPTCMNQFKKLFNTSRRSVDPECDEIKHWPTHLNKSNHVVIISKGLYFKVDLYRNKRLLNPAEFQDQIELILNDQSDSQPGEDFVASLTAGSRDKWQAARVTHFNDAVNSRSLFEIESAAFILVLDDNHYDNTLTEEAGRSANGLAVMGKNFLHGNLLTENKSCNIWFDKTFNLIVSACGNIGLNGEHAFADAPVVSVLLERLLYFEYLTGYEANGNARGERYADNHLIYPKRLRFQMTSECINCIDASYQEAKLLAQNLDLYILPFSDFDKNFITRKLQSSPDAFIQCALQLAHFYDKGCHVLTYESAMTRFYLKGRTETVRSCTNENVDFCKKFLEYLEFKKAAGDNAITSEKQDILNNYKQKCVDSYYKHNNNHVNLAKLAMTGQGVDRHLFLLYVMSYATGVSSEFLKNWANGKWLLSTSQTPCYQTKEIIEIQDKVLSAGGGFGPVSENGYGVSYIIMNKTLITFHVSSLKNSETTDSARFAGNIKRAMNDIGQVLLRE